MYAAFIAERPDCAPPSFNFVDECPYFHYIHVSHHFELHFLQLIHDFIEGWPMTGFFRPHEQMEEQTPEYPAVRISRSP